MVKRGLLEVRPPWHDDSKAFVTTERNPHTHIHSYTETHNIVGCTVHSHTHIYT